MNATANGSATGWIRPVRPCVVNDHKEDITKYRREAKSKSPLASFALQTGLTLQ